MLLDEFIDSLYELFETAQFGSVVSLYCMIISFCAVIWALIFYSYVGLLIFYGKSDLFLLLSFLVFFFLYGELLALPSGDLFHFY